jgi:hypothetical protein
LTNRHLCEWPDEIASASCILSCASYARLPKDAVHNLEIRHLHYFSSTKPTSNLVSFLAFDPSIAAGRHVFCRPAVYNSRRPVPGTAPAYPLSASASQNPAELHFTAYICNVLHELARSKFYFFPLASPCPEFMASVSGSPTTLGL